jgi:long-subunit fatty acid transport protein
MRKWWIMLALAAATTAVIPAGAQGGNGGNNLRLRAGVFFPQRSETRDAADKAWFTAGVEYAFQPLISPGFAGKITLSADFMGNKTMHNIPVQVNLVGDYERFTWSVGAGIGFAKNVDGEAKTGMTYSVGFSAEIGNTTVPLEVSVTWRGMTNVNNQLDGIAVHLQLRF